MDQLTALRSRFADLVTAGTGPRKASVAAAFAAVPREHYVGSGPWRILPNSRGVQKITDDPALLYQDVLVALTDDRPINNGQPSLHALCLAALNISARESIVHVGAGTGYYTAILAYLTGSKGSVSAYEIEDDLARRAAANLAAFPHVAVYSRSGSQPPLPACDVLYVNAGATDPLPVWLDALCPGGRLLFPLTPSHAMGAMLLITRLASGSFRARFLSRALFMPCSGAQNENTVARLTRTFQQQSIADVRSLHRHTPPDETCWFAGGDWWLSTAETKSD